MAVIESAQVQFLNSSEGATGLNSGTVVYPSAVTSTLIIDNRVSQNSQVLFIPRFAAMSTAGSMFGIPYVALGGYTAGSYTMTTSVTSATALPFITIVFN